MALGLDPRDLSLYVVLDAGLTAGRPLLEVAAAALHGGATVLQLRAKEMSTREMLETARALAGLAHGAGARFIVNDRADVALCAGADGVHLGPDDLPVAAARALLGSGTMIGFSAGAPLEAQEATRAGADYLGTGAVYGTVSKSDAGAPIGIAGLQAVLRATRLPVVAIGGVRHGGAAPCIRAGAVGIAVISAITTASDVERAARALRDEVEAAQGRIRQGRIRSE